MARTTNPLGELVFRGAPPHGDEYYSLAELGPDDRLAVVPGRWIDERVSIELERRLLLLDTISDVHSVVAELRASLAHNPISDRRRAELLDALARLDALIAPAEQLTLDRATS